MIQLMVSFRGTAPPQAILDAVREGKIGAFCLFNFNVSSPAGLRDCTDRLYQAARDGGQPPPLIGIDQEGGQLMAVTGGTTELPGNMALGATRSPELAEQTGRVLARELLAMGINLNFAPALDINSNPFNPVIGIRSFGDSPELVSELGQAMIRGIQAEGVMATAKHFPGHGDTDFDSHHGTPVVSHVMAHVQAVELAPFRAAIAAGVGAVMTAHVRFSAFDDALPATLSPTVLTDLLRRDLGFDGLILTDAMDMDSVARFGRRESVEGALNAGADLVLLAHVPDQLQLARETAALVNVASAERIQAARMRIPQARPSLSVIGSAEHQQIAQTIADRSITVVRDDDGLLPLRLPSEAKIAVITIQPEDLTPADTSSLVDVQLFETIHRRHPRTQAFDVPMNPNNSLIAQALDSVREADLVIIGTFGAERDAGQGALVAGLIERGQKVIAVALRTPYDLIAYPMARTYLCTYGIRAVSMEAVARVLFGEIEPTGILPCAIPGL